MSMAGIDDLPVNVDVPSGDGMASLDSPVAFSATSPGASDGLPDWSSMITGGGDLTSDLLNDQSIWGPGNWSPISSAASTGFNMNTTQNGEPGVLEKIMEKGGDILASPGNSVGAMLLAMALKGIGNIGTQKQTNRALDIQQGHLDLARQKEKSLQASRTGNFTVAAMQPKKSKFDGGMIYSQLTGSKP